jgi:nucleoside-diphosphate-sugar epimerase
MFLVTGSASFIGSNLVLDRFARSAKTNQYQPASDRRCSDILCGASAR